MDSTKIDSDVAEILKKYTRTDLQTVKAAYNQPGRFYHNFNHIVSMFQEADLSLKTFRKNNLQNEEEDAVIALAIIFHDYFYTPGETNNETFSAEQARKEIIDPTLGCRVAQAILSTRELQTPSYGNYPEYKLHELDFSVLFGDVQKTLDYDAKIRKEFQRFSWPKFKAGRLDFFRKYEESLRMIIPRPNVDELRAFYAGYEPNIAVYAGSFNRFHIGHLNVLEKAEAIFDKVILAQGVNPAKGPSEHSIRDVKTLSYRECLNYNGTLLQLLDDLGHDATIIRGLRSVTDLPEEIAFLRYLQGVRPDIKVAHLICDAQFEHISSSANRGLRPYGLEDKYIVP